VVTNAIDAVSEKQPPGRVTVRTEYDAQNAKVRIIVEDDGPGIPADQMDFLFSPFISSKKSRGTGLGLPVSQKSSANTAARSRSTANPATAPASSWKSPPSFPRPVKPSGNNHTFRQRNRKGPPAAEE